MSYAWLAVSRIVSPRPRACRCVPCRSSYAVSQACLAIQLSGQATHCIATHKAAPQSQYNLYRDSIWPGHAHECTGRPYRGPPGRAVASPHRVLGSYRGRALLVPARLCHDTVYYIMTQNREWAVAHPTASDQIFFFLHFSYWKTTNIYIYIYISFSSKPNKFIKIYFIPFFSSFTRCKTLENFFLHIIFFSFFFFISNSLLTTP